MSVPRLLVIGKTGQLARALVGCAQADALPLTLTGRPELDLDVPATIADELAPLLPSADIVINAAAYTAVDAAESDVERAMRINAQAVAMIAGSCAEAGKPLIHVSTDYVFPGDQDRAWREDDPTGPQSVYGRSKLAGETALAGIHAHHVIVRTSWVYSGTGQNFLTTMLRLGREREALSIVDDQTGCPTEAHDLAVALITIARQIHAGEPHWGTFHYCGDTAMSWAGFARRIFDTAGLTGCPVGTTTTEAFGAAAPRPAWSVLDCTKITKAYGIKPAPFQAALERALAET